MTRPTLFFLHALGSSGAQWQEVIAHLDQRYDCHALDLPGFGDNPVQNCTDVAALVQWFCQVVIDSGASSWLVVGHSMGAKIATLTAARAAAGEAGLAGLCGMVLLAGSPPAREPMDASRRKDMLGWVERGSISRRDADTFVSANTAGPLPERLRERAIHDVMRADPLAWRAWLEHGSREDWREEAGRLAFPACIIAGAEDGDLGAQAQRDLNLPHYAAAQEVRILAHAAHFLPYEKPREVASEIDALASAALGRALPEDFLALLNTSRVDPRMRARLIARNLPPDPQAAGVLNQAQRQVLAAIVAQVVDSSEGADELAHRIDIALAAGEGDGWRFAELPPDRDAWIAGLASVDALAGGFCHRTTAAQASLLRQLQRRELTVGAGSPLDPDQLALWFEDACAQIARVWTSLPRTMVKMGYDGFAVARDGELALGYALTGANEVEAWQLGARRA